MIKRSQGTYEVFHFPEVNSKRPCFVLVTDEKDGKGFWLHFQDETLSPVPSLELEKIAKIHRKGLKDD